MEGRIWARRPHSGVNCLHLAHPGAISRMSPQVPLPSHNGPQLTLGELAHITLVAEDVFNALL